MRELEDAVHADLSSTRQLPAQIAVHLSAHHEVDTDVVVPFFEQEFPKLEDYQVDLILSPAFTPTLQDQSRYSSYLMPSPVPSTELAPLVHRLAIRPTLAHFVLATGGEFRVPLREVIIDRYVRRLNLDHAMSDAVWACVRHLAPEADRSKLMAIARRPIWRPPNRNALLLNALSRAFDQESYRLYDFELLLRLAEQYQPTHAEELASLIPELLRGIETEISQHSVPKPFFSDRIREMHGGSRDQRITSHDFTSEKQSMLEALRRLAGNLGDA